MCNDEILKILKEISYKLSEIKSNQWDGMELVITLLIVAALTGHCNG